MKSAKPIKALLKKYEKTTIKKVKKLKFSNVENLDVYNITAPFKVNNKEYLLGRVELREYELSTMSIFFSKKGNKWEAKKNLPIFNLQDPFITKIKDNLILGGVEVMQRYVHKGLSFRTVFYKGKSIQTLKRFAEGPWGMKGIRLIQLPNNQIGVFTRPLGGKARRGKIGFGIINSLKELKPRKLTNFKIIPGIFARGEWGGSNEIRLLKDNKVGVLGHIAKFSKDKTKKYYYPISFIYDYEDKEVNEIKILATRKDLPPGESKGQGLYNILYSGGLIKKNSLAKLYVGASDVEAYEILIKDPFKNHR